MTQAAVEEVQTAEEYELIFVTIYEVRRIYEEPEFLVTWDKKDLETRKDVGSALLNALRGAMDRPASSECQILSFRKDNAGQASFERFKNTIAAGRRKSFWQNFADTLAKSYRLQRGFREGAILFTLFSTRRRTYCAILRVDFEEHALQVIREKRDIQLAGDVFLPEQSLRKCVIFPYRSKDTGKPDPTRVLVVQRDCWAHYFVDFISLEWYPTADALATEFGEILAGKAVSLEDLMSQIMPRITQTYENTGGATTRSITVQIDNVSIRFPYSDYEKGKVIFSNFTGRIVGVVVGSHLTPKYGGRSINVDVKLDRVNDLNKLIIR